MKKYFQISLITAILIIIITSCSKKNVFETIPSGTAVTLSSSTTTVAASASDSDNAVIKFSWTNPQYPTDSINVKYVLQLDTSTSFLTPTSITINTIFDTSLTGRQINDLILNTYGLKIGVPYNFNARVISSYTNNNDQKTSNTVALSLKAYTVPPKVAPPTSGHLYLVGDATQGGWNNPVPVPTQEFSQIDSVTYGGVFNLIGGKQYLCLPVNGDWTHKFAVADNTITGLGDNGGDFGYDLSQNFPGPSTDGWYTIIIDFQAGKFRITPFTGGALTNLFIVGDATAGGWNNPVPTPDQQFTQDNSSVFHITLPLFGGKQYLFLPVNGDWTHKYAVADNTLAGLPGGGSFGYDFGQNFPGPATDGTYTITANFATWTFSVK